MPHIDVKCTIWSRYNLPDDIDVIKLQELLDAGKSVDDAINELIPDTEIDYETLYDSEAQMSLEENNNQSTIELWNDRQDHEPVWTNEAVEVMIQPF